MLILIPALDRGVNWQSRCWMTSRLLVAELHGLRLNLYNCTYSKNNLRQASVAPELPGADSSKHLKTPLSDVGWFGAEFPDTFGRKALPKQQADQKGVGPTHPDVSEPKKNRGGKKNGAASSCSLLPLINEPSSSRIYLCNARRFIACLCTLEPSVLFLVA